MVSDWQGDTPVYLTISDDSEGIQIDLDEPGWLATYAGWMRRPGIWILWHKNGPAALMLTVRDGEQPYYVARHVGTVGSGGSNEIIAYGIGKKRLDGHVDRLWLMPGGSVCAGDDWGDIGIRFVKAKGPSPT